jgi:hypothetical protein
MSASMPAEYVDAFFDFYVTGTLDESQPQPDVRDVTGRAPRTFRQWAEAHAGAFRAGPTLPRRPATVDLHTEPGDRIEVSVCLEGNTAVIAVADSGCGIPPDDLDHIFGRFTRAEPYLSREAGGFGLGLPIVQAIAEAHHGSVRARSGSGQGATFEMVIPAVSALPRPGAIMIRCRAE